MQCEYSIIICTYNNACSLKLTLQSLLNINFEKISLEILIVDNNSNDETKYVILSFIKSSEKKNIKYIFESHQGLSYARNRGVEEAIGQYIIFIDDDVEIPTDWLVELNKTILLTNAAVIGGRVLLKYPTSIKPKWLDNELELFLSKADWGENILTLDLIKNWPVGTNIAFKKDDIKSEKFLTSLGRVGCNLRSGEEIELCNRLLQKKKLIVYAPNALIYHLVPNSRIKKIFFRKRSFYEGLSYFPHYKISNIRKYLHVFSLLNKCIIISIKQLFCINSTKRFKLFLALLNHIGQLKASFLKYSK